MSSISSTANISNLSEILRRANEHYAQVAIDVRSSLRPTHHAWKRARRLNLHVNVCMARNLDPSSVSQIPPAVLENTPPPAATALYPLPGREREIRNRLSVRSDIPRDVQMYEEDDYSSVSTTYSNVSLTPPSMPARKVYAVWRSSSSSSTSSSSSASSGGPVTPPDYEERSMPTCLKRKSVDEGYLVEKRPKYERKGFVNQYDQRIISKLPAPRRY